GNNLSDPVVLPTGKVGDKYETSGKDIAGWVLKETPENANGTQGTKEQTINYVYERAEAAKITVNYVDEKGNKISDSDILPTGKVGDKYETSGKDIAGWVLKETPENANGTHGTKEQTITYVYKKDKEPEVEPLKEGTVTVKYIDESGNSISPNVILIGKEGTEYTTSRQMISGYTFKNIHANSAKESGKYVKGNLVVTYIYSKNTEPIVIGSVTVKYVDENQKEIRPNIVMTGALGTTYKTNQQAIKGYKFKEMLAGSASETGKYVKNNLVVTYVYVKEEIPVQIGTVTARYVDTAGRQISADINMTGALGTTYKTNQQAIKGYKFKEMLAGSASKTGKYVKNNLVVTYVYVKEEISVQIGTVTARYVDTTGRQISADIKMTGAQGTTYKTNQQAIKGYKFKEMLAGSASETGKYAKNNLVVTYVYVKEEVPVQIGTVTARYVDVTGRQISADINMTGALGTTYKTNQQAIKGYKFKEMLAGSASETGKYAKNNLVVTYVYVKEEVPVQIGTVTARYVDATGRQISADINMTGALGTTYKTNQQVVKGYTFKEMLAGSASTIGKYTNENQIITYVYVENMKPILNGMVTVKYVDENGKALRADTLMTGPVGSSYLVNREEIKGYTFKEIKNGSAETGGTYTDNNLIVIYVYKKDPVNEVTKPEVTKPEVTKPEVIKPEVIKPINDQLKVTEKTSKNIKEMGKTENKNKKNDINSMQPKKSQKDKKQLPQTDEKANSVLIMVIGSLLAGLSLVGIFIKKRIKK
ncbi:MucBP domain-containing protein, partial [Dellaglioa algida]|uniref:MucBP domain-containing protein n=1 Tax=Dellaglioa algida TaxID=105612 RepID=UPI0024C4C891